MTRGLSSQRFLLVFWFGIVSSILLSSPTFMILASKRGECIATSSDTFQCFSNVAALFCEDEEPECPEWASNNECQRNPSYMLTHCRKSCRTCIDGHAGTPQRATTVDADRVVRKLADTAWYIQSRNLSTQNCRNHHAECTLWAVQEKCGSEDMREKCPAVCRQC